MSPAAKAQQRRPAGFSRHRRFVTRRRIRSNYRIGNVRISTQLLRLSIRGVHVNSASTTDDVDVAGHRSRAIRRHQISVQACAVLLTI